MPHIQAETAHDLFLAQGFVVAQDRLWQLELNRRVATGRLSELVGSRALATDRFLRRLGFARLADLELPLLDEEERAAIQAYADGVTAYLDQSRWRLPPEFLILGIKNRGLRPEPWTVRDSLAFAKYLAWMLSPNWDNEIVRARLIAELGFEATAALDPAGEALRAAGCPHEVDYGPVDWNFGLDTTDLSITPPAGQSNNWAIAGARTSSGAPLLANDAHLRPSQPGTWYEVHLRGGGYDVAGMNIPGFPGVVVGHNQRIAWGVTVAMADVQDLVVHRFDPGDPDRYQGPEGWRKVTRLVETIRVAGSRMPIEEVVRLTDDGPILNPIRTSGSSYQLTLRSAPLAPAHLARALLALNRAAGWADFQAALADWSAPALNFVYADTDGAIGTQLAGWIPRRRSGSGLLPVPGWLAEYRWDGLIPFADLPRSDHPADGICATANNRQTPPDYPFPISHEWTDDSRHERIHRQLTARPIITRGACQALQIDCHSQAGLDLLRALEGLEAEPGAEAEALALLRAWDGQVSRGSDGAAIYEVLRNRLFWQLGAHRVSAQLRDHYLGKGWHPVLNPVNTFPGRSGSLLRRWIAEARQRGEFDEVQRAAQVSLREAVAYLSARLGTDPSSWQWGRLHKITFCHALGDQPWLGRLWNVGPSATDGDSETVLQTAVDPWAPFAATGWAPSFRMVVDLGDFDRSVAVLPTGQSGHPLSRHYRDQHDLFLAGRYHLMPYSPRAVARATVARLELTP